MQLGSLWKCCKPSQGIRGKPHPPKFVFFTLIPAWNALYFTSYHVSCLRKCLRITLGNVVATKFAIQFIAKNVCWYLNTMSDLPIFILFGFMSSLQNRILLESIARSYKRNTSLYTGYRKFQSKLYFKETQGSRLGFVQGWYIKRSFEKI